MADLQRPTRVFQRRKAAPSCPADARTQKDIVLAPAGKENVPPQKTKKFMSINGIFEQGKAMKQIRERERERERHGVGETDKLLRPKGAGVTKQDAKPGFFTNSRRKSDAFQMHTVDPDFFKHFNRPTRGTLPGFGFFYALHTYCSNAAAAQEERNECLRRAVDNRRLGLDEDGNTFKPHVPTWEEIEELKKKVTILSDSPLDDLGEELMTVLVTQKDGTQVTKNVRFVDTLEEFFERYDREFAKINSLEEQLQPIESEIEALKADLTGESDDVKKANEKHETEMGDLGKELDNIKKKAEADLVAIREEEETKRKAVSKKIKRVMADSA